LRRVAQQQKPELRHYYQFVTILILLISQSKLYWHQPREPESL
jgi:hypothetical protein